MFGRRGISTLTALLLCGCQIAVAQDERPEVGEAPDPDDADLMLLQQRSMLTPRGQWVVEPSLSYVHANSLEVSIEGFTLIPAVAIGLIDVSETERDTSSSSLALRYGVTNRVEIGVKIPYVHREQRIRRRDILEGTSLDTLMESDGRGLGDIEFGINYQFNTRDRGRPFFIGDLKLKSRTGKDPFEVDRREILDEEGRRIGDVLLEQPTGSGFRGAQANLTMIYPSDPAVVFANFSYLHNFKRDVGPAYGVIRPGQVVGASIGLGLSLNDRTSISFGYDHNIVYRTRVENDEGLEPIFNRRHVGVLMWGLSHRLTQRTLSLSVGVGATEAAPDVQVTLRFPVRVGG
jgi:hypothetical protein